MILDFQGGVARNAVPDRAFCTVRVAPNAIECTEGVTKEAGENGATVLRGQGKSGHAAMPAGTVNAISLLVDCLLHNHIGTEAEQAYLRVLQKLHAATDGSAVFVRARSWERDRIIALDMVNNAHHAVRLTDAEEMTWAFDDLLIVVSSEGILAFTPSSSGA